jgi:pimeloyl-ACP methyl ester carboxylesterase
MASSTQNTVILLIHGAWQRPIHYLNLASSLQASNLDIRIPALATAGHQADVPGKSINDDVIVIREVLNELLAQNKTIVMVCHSYGGIPGTDAASGETVEERCKQGKFGGIKAVVYLAAFAIPTAGTNLLQMVGVQNATQHPPWWLPKVNLPTPGHTSEMARLNLTTIYCRTVWQF